MNTERILRAKAEKLFFKELNATHTKSGRPIVPGTPRGGGDESTTIPTAHDDGLNEEATAPSHSIVDLDRLHHYQEVAINQFINNKDSVDRREEARRNGAIRREIAHEGGGGGVLVRGTDDHADGLVEFTSRVEGCTAFAVCGVPPGVTRRPEFSERTASSGMSRGVHSGMGGGCSSVWTAGPDGSISVRSGDSMATVVELPERADGSVVTTLFATSTGHVWAGYTDGTVQVYDGSVCVLITEGAFHDGPVTCFCEMFDRKIVSGGADGSLVRWDSEDKNFMAISRTLIGDATQEAAQQQGVEGRRRPAGEGVSSLVCNGYTVIVGCSLTGSIVAIDAIEEVELGTYFDRSICSSTTPGKMGPGIDVISLLVVDGYLFAGYSNGFVAVWNNESFRLVYSKQMGARPVSITCDAVTDVVDVDASNAAAVASIQQSLAGMGAAGDATKERTELDASRSRAPTSKNSRTWITLETGVVHVWSTLADERFVTESVVGAFRGPAPVRTLVSVPTWETSRVFTVGSDGVSKTWCSMLSTGLCTLEQTVESLRAVLEEDEGQLLKLSVTVSHFKNVQQRRRHEISELLFQRHREQFLRRCYFKWQQWYLQTKYSTNRSEISTRIPVVFDQPMLRFRYLSKWYQWFMARRFATASQRYERALNPLFDERTMLLYAHKLKKFVATLKASKDREVISGVWTRSSLLVVLRVYYIRWRQVLVRRAEDSRRNAAASTLSDSNQVALMRKFYVRWSTSGEKVEQRVLAMHTLERFLVMEGSIQLKERFRKWYVYVIRRKQLKKLWRLAECVDVATNAPLRARYYQKWLLFKFYSLDKKRRERMAARAKEIASIREQYSALEPLIAEKRLIGELNLATSKLAREAAAESARLDAVREQQELLQEKLFRREEEELNRQQLSKEDVQEQLVQLLSRLKAKALNFYADQQLFHQMRERTKPTAGGQQAAVKVFLESHQAVKRVVVDVTRKPYMSAEERWPLDEHMLAHLPGHHLSTVHTAIKNMVLTFDIMDEATRDSITTDFEIVINGHNLMDMLDVCVAHKHNRLSSAPASHIAHTSPTPTPRTPAPSVSTVRATSPSVSRPAPTAYSPAPKPVSSAPLTARSAPQPTPNTTPMAKTGMSPFSRLYQ